MDDTNLFRWATSELSQDAFICWLLSWSDPENVDKDPAMHRAGCVFLNALLQLYGHAASADKVQVYKQIASADIVATIGSDRVLLIEDKTNTSEHGEQLINYMTAIQARFPGRIVLPIFCKTGDQSGYAKAKRSGYALYLRRDFLGTLRSIKQAGLDNSIFNDFLAMLEAREQAAANYRHQTIGTWSFFAWQGFFLALQEELPGLEWSYVANPSGGFMGAWWHSKVWSDWWTYLQIEENTLVMKMGCWDKDHPSAARAAIRDQWFEVLRAASVGSGIGIRRPPRRGNGRTMTAAHVGQGNSWLQRDEAGCLDMPATVALLREVMDILDRARAVPVAELPVLQS
jgi:hypothetical protein